MPQLVRIRPSKFLQRKKAKTMAAKKIQSAFRKRRSYKPSPAFAKQMKKYNTQNSEKKIMTFNNYLNGPGSGGYLQDIPGVGLTTAGLVNDSLSVAVLQTGRQLTQLNASINSATGATICVPLDGYSVLQGDSQNRLVGLYGKITSTYMNMNITMDPVDYNNEISDSISNALPHQFRVIQVKARRDKMVSPGAQVASVGVPSIALNLFRDESGENKGILSECATQDQFTWFVNKQFWTVLKDERFSLTPVLLTRTTDNPIAFNTNSKDYPSARFKKYWLPKPSTKVRFEPNAVDGLIKQEVVDYNYVVHTIILCKNTSSGERASNHWNVQVNGGTQFIDV